MARSLLATLATLAALAALVATPARAAFVAATDIAFAFESPPPGACDDGWTYLKDPAFPTSPGQCFKLLNYNTAAGGEVGWKTQTEAEADCAALSDDPGAVAQAKESHLASIHSVNELALVWLLCPDRCHTGLQIFSSEWFYVQVNADNSLTWRTFNPATSSWMNGQPSDRLRWTDGSSTDAGYAGPDGTEPFLTQALSGRFEPFFARYYRVRFAVTEPTSDWPATWSEPPFEVFAASTTGLTGVPAEIANYFMETNTQDGWSEWPPVEGWTSWANAAAALNLDSTGRVIFRWGLVGPGGNLTRPAAVCKKAARDDHPCFTRPCPSDSACLPTPDVALSLPYSCVCSPGRYYDSGSSACMLCDSVSVAPLPGSDECTDCALGEYASTDRTECVDCPLGTYRDAGMTACSVCPAGLAADSTGLPQCRNCGVGLKPNNEALPTACVDINECALPSSPCSPEAEACVNKNMVTEGIDYRCNCLTGSAGDGRLDGSGCTVCTGRDYAPADQSLPCTSCAQGSVPNSFHSACASCTPGRYADSSVMGPDTCSLCPAGLTSNANAASCTIDIDECAAGTHTCSAHATCANRNPLVHGGTRFTCTCNAGFAGDGTTCRGLPAIAVGSTTSFTVAENTVAISPGIFFNVTHTLNAIRANDITVMVAGPVGSPALQVSKTTLVDEGTAADNIVGLHVSLVSAPNFEAILLNTGTAAFTYTLTVNDGSGSECSPVGSPAACNPTSVTFHLTIIDRNDHPSFSGTLPPSGLTIEENSAAGTSAGFVLASDEDDGQSVRFVIVGGSGQTVFDIDQASGEVTLKTGASLNFEQQSSYTIDVLADDLQMDDARRRLLDEAQPRGVEADVATVAVDAAEEAARAAVEFVDHAGKALRSLLAVSDEPDSGFASAGPNSLLHAAHAALESIDAAPHTSRSARARALVERLTNRNLTPGEHARTRARLRHLLTARQTFTIAVTDVREAPIITTTAASVGRLTVFKNFETGTPIVNGGLAAIDEDSAVAGDSLFWSIVGGSDLYQGFGFDGDGSDGVLRVLDETAFDETRGEYVVTVNVRVRDRSSPVDPDVLTDTETLEIVVRCPISDCPGQIPVGPCSRSQPRVCVDPIYGVNENATIIVVGDEARPATTDTTAVPGLVTLDLLHPEGDFPRDRYDDCGVHLLLTYNDLTPNADVFEPHRLVRVHDAATGWFAAAAVPVGHELELDVGNLRFGEEAAVRLQVFDWSSNQWSSIGSTLVVGTRCFCFPCFDDPAVPTTFKNALCDEDSADANALAVGDWCPACDVCGATEWQDITCRGTTNDTFQDRVCRECRVCSFDEYQVSDCTPTQNRVCARKVMPGWPQLRPDGITGWMGRINGAYRTLRDEVCSVILAFRFSNNGEPEGTEAWFKVEEVNNAGTVDFFYAFRGTNHFENRLNLGPVGWENALNPLRFRLFRLEVPNGSPLPTMLPARTSPAWRASDAAPTEIGTSCVLSFPDATLVPSWPRPTVRTTGTRGAMEAVFPENQRDERCRVIVSARYASETGPLVSEFMIHEKTLNFGRMITLRRNSEAWVDLGEFPDNPRLVFTWRYSDGEGQWIDAGTVTFLSRCLEVYEEATILPGFPVRSDVPSGMYGSIEGAFGDRRDKDCNVIVRVRYVDLDSPDVREFRIRETGNPGLPFTRIARLPINTESLIFLGNSSVFGAYSRLTFELASHDIGSAWRASGTVTIGPNCVRDYPPVTEVPDSRRPTARMTGRLGLLENTEANALRDETCSIVLRALFFDTTECLPDQTRRFFLRERNSPVNFIRTLELRNGEEVLLDLGGTAAFDFTERLRFSMEYSLADGTTFVGSVVDIGPDCASLYGSANLLPATISRYDIETSTRGRIFQLFGTRRAAAEPALNIEECDVVVGVAYSAALGPSRRSFLIQEVSNYPNVVFRRTVILDNFRSAWVNLGHDWSGRNDLNFQILYPTGDGTWLRPTTAAIRISSSCVATFEPAVIVPGFPRTNLAETGPTGRISNALESSNRARDGEVAVLFRYCHTDGASHKNFVIRETSNDPNVVFSRSISIDNCQEAILNFGAASWGARTSLRFTIFTSNGAGDWATTTQFVTIGNGRSATSVSDLAVTP